MATQYYGRIRELVLWEQIKTHGTWDETSVGPQSKNFSPWDLRVKIFTLRWDGAKQSVGRGGEVWDSTDRIKAASDEIKVKRCSGTGQPGKG